MDEVSFTPFTHRHVNPAEASLSVGDHRGRGIVIATEGQYIDVCSSSGPENCNRCPEVCPFNINPERKG